MNPNDTTPPTVTINSPTTSEFPEYVLEGEVSDDFGIVSLGYRVDDSARVTLSEIEGEFGGFVELAEGENVIEVVARDVGGNETVESISVTYTPDSNPPPIGDPGATNALSLIEEALADGDLDEETATLYRLYAAFGDDRLPAEFEVGGYVDAGVAVRKARASFDSLSAAGQEAVRPFLIPPIYEGTWYQDSAEGQATEAFIPKGDPPLGCDAVPDPLWDSIETGNIRVWWSTLRPAHSKVAFAVLNELETKVWPKLTALMGGPPPEDLAEPSIVNDGCSSHYDVYVINIQARPNGGLPYWAYVDEHDHGSGCDAWPSYMVVGGNASIDATRRKYAMAHEFMHSMQLSYRSCLTDDHVHWLAESTATWTVDHVEPTATDPIKPPDHFEHLYAKQTFFNAPDQPIYRVDGDHEYGAYIWPFYLTKSGGNDSFIPDLWSGVAEAQDLPAVLATMNGLVSGGFDEAFPEFMLRVWNEEPVWTIEPESNFNKWDSMTATVSNANPKGLTEVSANLGGQKDRKILLTLAVEPMAAELVHVKFDDSSVHSAMFSNGYTFDLKEGAVPEFPIDIDSSDYATELDDSEKKGRHIWALVKQDGMWLEEAYDLTDVAFVPICQDVPDEAVEEMIFIFTNANWEDNVPATPKSDGPRLFISNMGCGAWAGRATFRLDQNEPDSSLTITADFEDLLFTRETSTVDNALRGQEQAYFLETIVPAANSGGAFVGVNYEIDSARVPWSVSGVRQVGMTTCVQSGSGTFDESDSLGGSFFRVAPLLSGALGMGSIYRSYLLQLQFFSTTPVVNDSCSGPSPFATGLSGGLRGTPAGDFLVSEDGQSIQKTWSLEDATLTLDLEAREIF